MPTSYLLYTATILLLLFYIVNRKPLPKNNNPEVYADLGILLECMGLGAILFIMAVVYLVIRLSK